jgi:hypothetical protein
MIRQGTQVRRANIGSKAQFPINLKWFSGLIALALLTALGPVQAAEPDDEYLRIYSIIDQADSLSKNGQADLAKAKYQEAQVALLDFNKSNPSWNVKVVTYRLNYLAERIADQSQTISNLAAGAAATNTSEARTEIKAATLPTTSQVKLLEAGAEPRKVLRRHAKSGDKQTLAIALKMAMAMEAGEEQSTSIKIPAMQMTMDVTVKDVADNGDITYDMVVSDAGVASDPEVMPQVAEAMKAALAGVRGLTGTGTLSDHGYNKRTEIKMPPGINPQIAQTMDQMKESFSSTTTPLPEEAVGLGARWEFKTKLKSQGMTIDQTTTSELLSIEDERVTLRSTIVQNAANQKIQNPALPGLMVDLSKMTGNGTGSTTLDLTKLMPLMGTVDEHTEVVMGMNMGQQKQSMTMKMDVNVQITAK